MNRSYIIFILFISCLSNKDIVSDDNLFSIGFTNNNDKESVSIDFYVNDSLIFEKILLKKRDNSLNLFDDVIVYKNGVFEIQGIGNGIVKRKKKFLIKSMDNLKIGFKLNDEKTNFTINTKEGKNYHLNYDKSKIELFEFRQGRTPVYRKVFSYK